MIVSVSRRTDIPAFYMDWFMNRLDKGFVYVRNPMNRKQISQVSLKDKDVSCFVFWTKNPKYLLMNHSKIHRPYFVQLTITSYLTDLEKNVEDKKAIINDTIELSKLNQGRIIWRYDPIIINDRYTLDYHLKYFEKLCGYLKGRIRYCVISFVEVYKKIQHHFKDIKDLNKIEIEDFLTQLLTIAKQYEIDLKMCSSSNDYSHLGVKSSQCIDEDILREMGILGYGKDKNQRQACRCITSADIGSYNTCLHSCLYCYANKDHLKAREFYSNFDKTSEILGPPLVGDEKITIKHIDVNNQLSLFL